MRLVRLVYNYLFLILFPIIGPCIALKNRGIDAFIPSSCSLEDILEHGGIMLIMFTMPLILLITVIGKFLGMWVDTFTPFNAIGFLCVDKNDTRGKDILTFVDNTLFRGVQWISEIKTYEQDYHNTRLEMKEILDRCCKKI